MADRAYWVFLEGDPIAHRFTDASPRAALCGARLTKGCNADTEHVPAEKRCGRCSAGYLLDDGGE